MKTAAGVLTASYTIRASLFTAWSIVVTDFALFPSTPRPNSARLKAAFEHLLPPLRSQRQPKEAWK